MFFFQEAAAFLYSYKQNTTCLSQYCRSDVYKRGVIRVGCRTVRQPLCFPFVYGKNVLSLISMLSLDDWHEPGPGTIYKKKTIKKYKKRTIDIIVKIIQASRCIWYLEESQPRGLVFRPSHKHTRSHQRTLCQYLLYYIGTCI